MQRLTDREERDAATKKVVDSKSRKKLIVAGPGTGKTHIFDMLIRKKEEGAPREEAFLVLTFIGGLTADLKRKFRRADEEPRAKVHTLHEYCRDLVGLSKGAKGGDQQYYVKLPTLIKEDWEWLKEKEWLPQPCRLLSCIRR
jgi:UvrD/REP helicase N-terminal domain